ncbi:CECR1 [Lepeophtheirus salmonis]|uniref:CECR1 n=1 Tax=Lepeophtheirus salmonis TaxID=72036 RepID=A0A7R8CK33_LEPSM|nr:CECR1 [Lepeophtheirus salmonis]CAF2811668.1 CECR1 [Lepeophtheirus salmonis]
MPHLPNLFFMNEAFITTTITGDLDWIIGYLKIHGLHLRETTDTSKWPGIIRTCVALQPWLHILWSRGPTPLTPTFEIDTESFKPLQISAKSSLPNLAGILDISLCETEGVTFVYTSLSALKLIQFQVSLNKDTVWVPKQYLKGDNLKIGLHYKSRKKKFKDYYEERIKLLKEENESYLGADIKLNEHEKVANSKLMKFKLQELEIGFQSPSSYNPSSSFFNRIQEIEESNVYKFIEKLPKGGVLHVHDISLAQASWVVQNITYEENLYASGYPSKPAFKWADYVTNSSHWILLSELRNKFTAEKVDQWLMKHLDIRVNNPYEEYSDIDKVWTSFMNVMSTVENLLSYAPIYDRYFYEGLSEFEKDGASYIEIRTVFPEKICKDLQCSKTLSTLQVAKLNQKTIDRFLEDHPHFCGVTLYLNRLRKLRHYLPNLVRGFDLVGQEDKDENLIDAILLNTTRIGHGYAILKHPILKKLVAKKNIAIEILPNIESSSGVSKGYKKPSGNDDPGSWGANGVSFDYYEAFMGLAGKHMDLRLLKKIVFQLSFIFFTQATRKKQVLT